MLLVNVQTSVKFQKSMECVDVGSSSICCREASYITGGGRVENEVNGEAEITFDCPQSAFTVVDEKSRPLRCNEKNCKKVYSSVDKN